ncbi:MAG: VOC family protein [Anaerolineales bacterium]|nr:VOC family protein [Anaerolineales bacterium]
MSQTESKNKTEHSIHPATTLGHVSLTVANLENQLLFYQQVLGFKLHWRKGSKAGLGAGGVDLLILNEEPNLKKYRGVTGLYHFAVLFPNRRELAIALARLYALKYRNHPTDHIMTKTTYLDDPEGNGIELYAESPEDGTWTMKDGKYETRRADGSWSDGREPLDVEALFKYLKEDDKLDVPIPPETKVGHIHLHVRDIPEALDFYHGIIGFDVMGHAKDFQMAFVSAGGYHHHIGLNTWQGAGAPPPPADAVGLRHFTVDFLDQQSLDEVIARVDAAGIPSNRTEDGILLHDPSQNGVILRTK